MSRLLHLPTTVRAINLYALAVTRLCL